jgi:hypothetical protein
MERRHPCRLLFSDMLAGMPAFLELSINFAAVGKFKGQLSFRVGVIKMRHGFRDSEKPMHVVGVGKHGPRDFPGGGAVLRNQRDHFRLSFANQLEITIEQLFEIVDGFTMTAKD